MMKSLFVATTVCAFFCTLSLPANAESQDIFRGRLLTDSYSFQSDDYVKGTVSGQGDVVVGRVLNNQSGIRVYVRTPQYDRYSNETETDRWLSSTTIQNPSVSGSADTTIRDFRLVSGSTNRADYHSIYASWIVSYYDESGGFLDEKLYIYSISPETGTAYRVDDLGDSDAGNGDLSEYNSAEQYGDISYMLYPADDSFDVVFTNGDTTYTGGYSGQDEWSEGYMTELSSFSGAYEAVSCYGEHFIVQNGSMIEIHYRPIDGDSTESSKIGEFEGNYVDSTDDILYSKGKKLMKADVACGSGVEDHSVVFKRVPGLRSADIAYNDYGDGQSIVTVKSKNKGKQRLHVALERADGWVKQKNVFTRKKYVRVPVVHTFSNGEVRVVWKHRQKLYQSVYEAGDTQWSTASRLAKVHQQKKWKQPYIGGEYRSYSGKKSIDLFQSTLSNKRYLARWKMGDSDSMDVARILKGYALVSTDSAYFDTSAIVDGERVDQEAQFRLVVLRKGKKIRAIVSSDKKLFSSN